MAEYRIETFRNDPRAPKEKVIAIWQDDQLLVVINNEGWDLEFDPEETAKRIVAALKGELK